MKTHEDLPDGEVEEFEIEPRGDAPMPVPPHLAQPAPVDDPLRPELRRSIDPGFERPEQPRGHSIDPHFLLPERPPRETGGPAWGDFPEGELDRIYRMLEEMREAQRPDVGYADLVTRIERLESQMQNGRATN